MAPERKSVNQQGAQEFARNTWLQVPYALATSPLLAELTGSELKVLLALLGQSYEALASRLQQETGLSPEETVKTIANLERRGLIYRQETSGLLIVRLRTRDENYFDDRDDDKLEVLRVLFDLPDATSATLATSIRRGGLVVELGTLDQIDLANETERLDFVRQQWAFFREAISLAVSWLEAIEGMTVVAVRVSLLGNIEALCGKKAAHEGSAEFVYLVCRDGGPTKIGRSVNVAQRIKSLESAGGPGVKLLHSIPTDNARSGEAFLHELFRAKRVSGEWFDLKEDDVSFLQEALFWMAVPRSSPAPASEHPLWEIGLPAPGLFHLVANPRVNLGLI